MASFLSQRRYYLSRRIVTRLNEEHALSSLLQGKQEAEPNTPLPATFPRLAELQAIGYSAEEDLVGADADELIEWVPGLSTRDAEAILAAHAAL